MTIMTKKSKNRFIPFGSIILSLAVVSLVKPVYSQSPVRDTTFHPYHVNYWATGSVLIAGIALEKLGVPWISNKSDISIAELQALDRTDFTAIDRWALKQDPSNMNYYVDLSDNVLAGMVLLPALTMLDHDIRRDWLDVLLMYAETQIITNNIYLYAPFGPTFQDRLRPVVYYDALGYSEVRTRGANRSSFYSGHVASGASASFFTAKVFCDYHPELGWKKYLVYGAAALPPLILSYFRLRALAHFPSDLLVGLGVGALCGIVIPELHRIRFENTSLGLYSSSEGTGIRLTWQPDFGE
jgi:membrane-associated phospholipid phosphatase